MAARIIVASFRHPSITNGMVHFEDEHYPVVSGIVECPQEIGLNAEWAQVDQPVAKDLDTVLSAAKAQAPKKADEKK